MAAKKKATAKKKPTKRAPGKYVKELCIHMPPTFPAAVFTKFMARVRAVLLNPKGPLWSEMAGASNLMGWRFRNAADALTDFSNSWKKYGHAKADHEEVYKRDRMFFEFFSAGVSCIEATCYGIYALAADHRTLSLPFGPTQQKQAYPRQVLAALKTSKSKSASLASLVTSLDTMLASPEWGTFNDFRNRLNHRSNLPPIITGVMGGPLPPTPPIHLAATTSTKAFAGNVADLRKLLAWLAATQKALLVGATGL